MFPPESDGPGNKPQTWEMNTNRIDAMVDGAFMLPGQYPKHITMQIKGLRCCLGIFLESLTPSFIRFYTPIKPKAGSEAPLFMSFSSCPYSQDFFFPVSPPF